jgi:2-polyprenyl-3-methyl-5-hydroxy-6-metoxy-1,4-benzoquinol methylase
VQISKCRVCSHEFFKGPLLRYENMPGAAQCMPDEASLESDTGVDLEVHQCSGCGLVQLNNAPVHYYREVIRAAAYSDEMKGFRIKQFNDFVTQLSLEGKKVIEIGCGRGEYLSILQKAGVDAYGLEHAPESVKQCVENGLQVSEGFVDSNNCELKHAPFDAFFILSFLEHLPDPNSALRGIYNNLNEEAVGLIEVPNFDMILRDKLFSEFIGDHLFYFTRETLSSTLRFNGFDIIECNETWYKYIISATVKKREKHDLSCFYEYQERLKSEINKYIYSFKDKGVAIWGAGHQALAVISLINLSDKIRYVVDSATFKQGKYTPASHLPIVSPDTLYSDQIEAIIVMAASYSDEVAKIIRHEYGDKINVAILRTNGLEIV